MNAKDQSKLARSGYTIIRRQNEPEPHFKIKDSAGPDSWRKFKEATFKSKAERDRYVRRLLTENNIIED
jgi:hypothetical protein